MDCIIYARFSPRKGAESCESCEVQRAYCEQFAIRKGWSLCGYYEDRAVSGSVDIDAREIHRAIAALRKGDVLLAYRRDRFARDLLIGLEIERAVAARGATLAVVDGDVFGASDDPGVQMMKQMLMVIAEYERKIIAARTKAAMIYHLKNGRRIGGRVPYGYDADPGDSKRVVRNEREQATVALIMELHGKGKNLHEIARALSPESSRTGRWHPQVIKAIIRRVERDAS